MEVTDKMREGAKEYLRKRMENEQSYSANLDVWIREVIDVICRIVIKYNITAQQLMDGQIPANAKREIDAVISELYAEIYDAVFTLAEDERDDSAWFLAFLDREFENGWTFAGRLEQYTENLGNQILMAIAALSLLEVASNSWVSSISGNIKDIYNSPFVRAVTKERLSYFSPKGYGKGVPHNMAVAIDILGKQEIANAWMEYEYEEEKKDGAVGFYVYRGSSYDCPLCDSYVGYHDISKEGIVPVHANCMCYVVYV